MAKKLGIASTRLSAFEKGRTAPSVQMLDKVSEVFGIPTPDFMLLASTPESLGEFVEKDNESAAHAVLRLFGLLVNAQEGVPLQPMNNPSRKTPGEESA